MLVANVHNPEISTRLKGTAYNPKTCPSPNHNMSFGYSLSILSKHTGPTHSETF